MENRVTRSSGLNTFQHRWRITLLQKFKDPVLTQKGSSEGANSQIGWPMSISRLPNSGPLPIDAR